MTAPLEDQASCIQSVEIGEHFVGLDDVGIFRVHIAERDGMARLAAVEAALLDHRDAVIVAEGVQHGRAHGPTSWCR